MSTLKVGIVTYEGMKACTIAVARGKLRVPRDEPKVWFTPTESFAKVLSVGNRELLRVIAEREGTQSWYSSGWRLWLGADVPPVLP